MKKIRRIERKELIAFYVSTEEKEAIAEAAAEKDLSLSDYCRKTLLARETNCERN